MENGEDTAGSQIGMFDYTINISDLDLNNDLGKKEHEI